VAGQGVASDKRQNMKKYGWLAMAVVGTAFLAPVLEARQGDVWGWNGVYEAQISDASGATIVYKGSSYYAAVNAAINGLTPNRTYKERVNVLSSGSSGSNPNPSSLWAIRMRPNTIIDFKNTTLTCNGGSSVVGVIADRCDNIEIRNVKVVGNPRYGFLIQSCHDAHLSGINMAFSGSENGIGIRADNYTRYRDQYAYYMRGFRLEGRNTFTGMSLYNHGVETANLENGYIGQVESTDIGGCSVLLNRSRNFRVDSVIGRRCSVSSGYAAFRMANDCGPSISVGEVIARNCGRGLFTTTYSYGLSVDKVDLFDSVLQGILLQTGWNTRIGKSGVTSRIYYSREEGLRADDSQTSTTFYDIILRGNGWGRTGRGIWETDRAGGNRYVNCNAVNDGYGNDLNVTLGPGSTFSGQQ